MPISQPPAIGTFSIEVFSGRRRQCASQFKIRCHAVALQNSQILLLSVVGAETSVKALLAGLRSSAREQNRIAYAANIGSIHADCLIRCSEGYRVFRSKLAYGLWHVLLLSRREEFMPVLSEATVWQLLRSNRFTTPLLQEWMPWLFQKLKEKKLVTDLQQFGCHAGLLTADTDALDKLVSGGVRSNQLKINGQAQSSCRSMRAKQNIVNLDDYMLAYGPMLARQAEQSLNPLHVPGRDPVTSLDLLREPFEAQTHVIEATRQALTRQNALLLVGECGTGKTLMGMAAIHAHAHNRPYRALVFCPGQLVGKWEREIRQTIPDAEVFQIASWKSLLHLNPKNKPVKSEWYIIARDRAKLGAKWQPACLIFKHYKGCFLRCPSCGLRLVTDDREPLSLGSAGQNGQVGSGLWKRRLRCEWVLTNPRSDKDADFDKGNLLVPGCGSPLWQMNGEVWRYEPALYIKRHLRHFFKYLILDEIHEEKGADTAQGHAAGALAAACQKTLALTGTLIGGYAEHLRPLLFRLSPRSLVKESLGWPEVTAFNEHYGRIETRITVRSGSTSEDNRMSRGSKSTTKSVRPGIMPALFGRHLIDKAVFLQLSEVADNLPPLEEECVPVRMDAELAHAYKHDVEEPLVEAMKQLLKKKDKRLLGTMVQTLLAYPDYPFHWNAIGYWNRGGQNHFVHVTQPPHLREDILRPKELTLIDLIHSEKAKGRKVWVYVQYTDKHDVQGRLSKLLIQTGLKVKVLQASLPLAQREDWITKNAPNLDVVISHPKLVETGLDLFDKGGSHNFPTLCFYETGYNLFTLRQASRRSWRIGQEQPCRVLYLHYEGTMQDRAMALMGKKLTAALALEGTFSSEGLIAMAGEDANIEIALAKSLVERLDEGDTRRLWARSVKTSPATNLVPQYWWDDSFRAPKASLDPKPTVVPCDLLF